MSLLPRITTPARLERVTKRIAHYQEAALHNLNRQLSNLTEQWERDYAAGRTSTAQPVLPTPGEQAEYVARLMVRMLMDDKAFEVLPRVQEIMDREDAGGGGAGGRRRKKPSAQASSEYHKQQRTLVTLALACATYPELLTQAEQLNPVYKQSVANRLRKSPQQRHRQWLPQYQEYLKECGL